MGSDLKGMCIFKKSVKLETNWTMQTKKKRSEFLFYLLVNFENILCLSLLRNPFSDTHSFRNLVDFLTQRKNKQRVIPKILN